MLAPTQLTTTWPIPGDVADIGVIIDDQAATIAAQEVLLHAYQTDLNSAQQLPPATAATGNGTAGTGATANQLTVSSVVGTIVNGAVLTDGGSVPAGTTILGQISGTAGGAGVYLTSAATTASNVPITFTPPPPAFASTWPTPTDAPTLMAIQQAQTTVLRLQSSLLQAYQELLTVSQTAPPPTGP